MKTSLALFSFAMLAIAITAGLQDVQADPAPAVAPFALESDTTFEITEGPTAGEYSFPGGTTRGVMVKGKITPPLPSGITGGIKSGSKTCGTPPTATEVSSSCLMGGANGGSFTAYVKTGTGCLTSDCKKIKITFELDDDNGTTYCITIRNPDASAYVEIIPVMAGVSENVDNNIPLRIIGSNGQQNTTFTGHVTVIPGSLLGTGILVDGASGATTVYFEDGIGTMTVRAIRTVPGDTLTFDFLCGDRLSLRRDSLSVW